MKIIKYNKKNNNQYIITTDKQELVLYDDTILKYDLLLKSEISDAMLKEINTYNKSLFEYYKVIKKLKSKRKTEKEVRDLFIDLGIPKGIYEDFLQKLKNAKLIDDYAYINAYIHDHIFLKLEGPRKIETDLLHLGFLDKDIKDVLNTIDDEIYISNINKIINKKIKTNHKDSGKVLEIKIATFIVHLGYTKQMTMEQIQNYNFDNPEILNKEYLKEKNKLEKKYNGEELKYKLRQKLYQKGFSLDEINKLMQ